MTVNELLDALLCGLTFAGGTFLGLRVGRRMAQDTMDSWDKEIAKRQVHLAELNEESKRRQQATMADLEQRLVLATGTLSAVADRKMTYDQAIAHAGHLILSASTDNERHAAEMVAIVLAYMRKQTETANVVAFPASTDKPSN